MSLSLAVASFPDSDEVHFEEDSTDHVCSSFKGTNICSAKYWPT